jgi:hypothetical protein
LPAALFRFYGSSSPEKFWPGKMKTLLRITSSILTGVSGFCLGEAMKHPDGLHICGAAFLAVISFTLYVMPK